MDSVETLIVGAGVTGLATAAALGERKNYLVLEADTQIGGYCKTVRTAGFVWDYSGHFFHFKHRDVEQWLRDRMPGQKIRTVAKKSFILYGAGAERRWIDFPFQKNIHQLPQAELIDCIHDLYFAKEQHPSESNFLEMLYARLGKSICEKFLVPYNEKLYATDLATLDKDAMGRFFPHANVADIVRNMKTPDNASYNSTFTYPQGGAIEYVNALASAVKGGSIVTGEGLVSIDVARRIAKTAKREIQYRRLVSSMPLPRLCAMANVEHDASAWSWNKVLVFNLGFDGKGPRGVHWLYVPDRTLCFYRVGFYDNIFEADRMSLYIEIGLHRDERVDIDAMRARVLQDLQKAGILTTQSLVAHHWVEMDPAYVHITKESIAEHARVAADFAKNDVYSVGRYGRWTYCSIEDNIVEARALVHSWG